MKFEAILDDPDALAILGLLNKSVEGVWVIVAPNYLMLDPDDLFEKCLIDEVGHKQFFALSRAQFQSCLEPGKIGFDWTDLTLVINNRYHTELVQISCVDSAVWTFETTSELLGSLLRGCGQLSEQ